jgi:hypothetical protein
VAYIWASRGQHQYLFGKYGFILTAVQREVLTSAVCAAEGTAAWLSRQPCVVMHASISEDGVCVCTYHSSMYICRASSLPVQCVPVALVVRASSECLLGKHCVCILRYEFYATAAQKEGDIDILVGCTCISCTGIQFTLYGHGVNLVYVLTSSHYVSVSRLYSFACFAYDTRLLLVKTVAIVSSGCMHL